MTHDSPEDHAAIPGQESTHHVTPISTYFSVFVLLFILMIATIAAAEYLHLPTILMNVIAMAIAVAKATFVVAVFMGVRWTTQLAKVYAIGGFVWATLLTIAFCDYITRKDELAPAWIEGKASPVTDGIMPEVGKELPRQYFGAH